MRYLTGFTLADGEEKVSGDSGRFLVGTDDLVILADSRYTIQARREAPEARLVEAYNDLIARWPEPRGVRRRTARRGRGRLSCRTRCGRVSLRRRPISTSCPSKAGSRRTARPRSLPRSNGSRPACAVADRALAALLPEIQPGLTEADIALRLEWRIRTGGAEALAFDVACLSGPEAALPHGAPGDRPILAGTVLLFDFGAQVAGYRSDMTRTLFVGEPESGVTSMSTSLSRAHRRPPSTSVEERRRRAAARCHRGGPSTRLRGTSSRTPDTAPHFGHGTGHGIGLATHEAPSLGRQAPDDPLPSPTVFSVEPGVYLDGQMGVRIEDLVLLDAAAGRVERLTRFPRDVIVVGT